MRGALALLCLALASCVSGENATSVEVVIRAQTPEGSGPVFVTGSLEELGPWRADALRMSGAGRERIARLRVPAGTVFEVKVTAGAWEREGLGPSGTVMPNTVIRADGPNETVIAISDWKHDVEDYVADPAGAGVLGELIYWRNVVSPRLEATRHVSIYLPPQYGAAPDARWPVIYVHDGQNLFDPRIANTGVDWGVDEAMETLVRTENLPPAIIVGVWSTPDRRFEYAPTGVLERLDPDVLPMALREFPDTRRLADAYVAFLAEELKPRIDAAFRTRSDRDHTFLMGSSMGGLISLYAMAERPDVFGGAACLSMHWPIGVSEPFVGEKPNPAWRPAVLSAFRTYLAARHIDPATHRLWIDRGTGFLDHVYEPYLEDMKPILASMGFRPGDTLEARVYPGANHNETAWRARLTDPLKFLLQPRATF
jgi:enterochelin esterase-like enzyme